MIEVTGDDGRVHSFADGTTQAQIDAALDAMYGIPPHRPPAPSPYASPARNGRGSQQRSSFPISQTQLLWGALAVAVLAGLAIVGFTIQGDGASKTVAQTPTADVATVIPSDQVPAGPTVLAVPSGPSVTPEAFAGFVATQQGGNLTVRALAAATGTQIAKLPHGAPISVTGAVTMPDGLWRQVSVGGVTGFVKGEYISQTQPAPIAKAPAPPVAKMIPREFWAFASTKTNSSVNVRSSPSTTATITSSIPTGDSVYVVGEQGGWYLIEWQGKRGWASTSFITMEDRD